MGVGYDVDIFGGGRGETSDDGLEQRRIGPGCWSRVRKVEGLEEWFLFFSSSFFLRLMVGWVDGWGGGGEVRETDLKDAFGGEVDGDPGDVVLAREGIREETQVEGGFDELDVFFYGLVDGGWFGCGGIRRELEKKG